MPVNRLGATLNVDDHRLDQLPASLHSLVADGYTDGWTSELTATDAFAPLTVAALTTPGLHLGTSIAGVFLRSPALMAMQALAVAELSPNPTYLGIGAGSAQMVTGWHGIPHRQPYARVRDTVRFLRQAFSGERISFASESFTVDGFRLARAPERPPRLLVAALREKMLRLAGDEADGVVLNWLSADDVVRVLPGVLETNPSAEVVARIFVLAGEPSEARASARRFVTAYLNTGPYAAYHEWLGRGPLLEPMWQAWRAGDRAGALAAVPDRVVDDLFLSGDDASIWARVEEYVRAGVTVPVLSINGAPDAVRELTASLGRRFRAQRGRTQNAVTR